MKILFDSDFIFGLLVTHDPHHEETKEIIEKLDKSETQFFVSNVVIQEAATVLSNKVSQQQAIEFYKHVDSIADTFVMLGPEVEKKAWRIFLKQAKKRTSFVDCANLAILKEYNLDKIASFDGFYPKELLLK